MKRTKRRHQLLLLGVAAVAFLAGCAKTEHASYKAPDPFVLEQIKGTEKVRLVLQPKAVERTAIKTEKVTGIVQFGEVGQGKRIPYDALLYNADGTTFVYTNPKPNVYESAPVTVDYVEGETVVIKDGPKVGTAVVTDGAAELWGVEFGVGK